MGRGIAIALALSLAANVFMGGFVIGGIAGGPGFHAGPHGFDFRRGGKEHFADLPEPARVALKQAFIAHREDGREERRAAHEIHREFIEALGADVFDRAGAEAIVAKFETVETSERAGMAALLVEAAASLSAEDRKALARHLKRRAGRH